MNIVFITAIINVTISSLKQGFEEYYELITKTLILCCRKIEFNDMSLKIQQAEASHMQILQSSQLRIQS